MPKLVSTLAEIFANHTFRIPDYQRGYAWDSDQWEDLIEDLKLLREGRDHYTGTLVLCPVDGDAGAVQDAKDFRYTVYEVIDGQQRLTTALLFLHAIHAELEQLEGQQAPAEGLWERYLAVRDQNGQWMTKLVLNQDCQSFYYVDLLGLAPGGEGPTVRSHQLLAGARTRFASYLSRQRAERGANYARWLRSLYAKITRHLTFIVYDVEDENDAHVIFETMNDRGRPLTELEKVKNYLLYVSSKLDLPAEHHLRSEINSTWKYILERLMGWGLGKREDEDRLLRAHWLMAYDHNRRNWHQSRSIKDRFSLREYQGRHPQLLDRLYEYLRTLKAAATAYCDIHRPGHSMAFNDFTDRDLRSQIVTASEKLVRLGTRTMFLPLLVAVRLCATDNGQTYLKAVELCEKFDFRVYQWMGYHSNAGRSRLLYLAYRFYQDQDAQSMLHDFAEACLSRCLDRQFVERFERETVNWYRWDGLKYLLYEYEQQLAQQERERVQVQWEEIYHVKRDTIEHILPQTPADGYWLDRFDEAQRKRWTNDIGNLTLTYDNSCLGNKPFPEKKGDPTIDCCYATSKLFIEQRLARHEEWTESEIRERREQIRTWATERWRVEAPDAPSAPSPGEATKEAAEQRLLRYADEAGTGAAFRTVLETARRYPGYLYPRMQTNWGVVMFTSPRNKSKALFYLSPGLWVGANYGNWERFHGIAADEARSILRAEEDATLDPADVEDFAKRLEQLMARVQEIAGSST